MPKAAGAQVPVRRSWFTIERLRTIVLAGGGLLVVAIAIFLGLGQWRVYRQLKDLPKRLGIDIQQQADGVNYTQSRKGKTLFKIHAARAMQMKISGKMLLHDVKIDLYGEDGSRTDTISGSEFEYDHTAGIAKAAGAVEITLTRPDVRPAIAPMKPGTAVANPHLVARAAGQMVGEVDREIHVKTSGLSFDQKSGLATTAQQVDFVLQQGSGSSIGATYDSAHGQLILNRNVALHVDHNGDPVAIHAGHAEFERTAQLCRMSDAIAEYSRGKVQTANALIHFRNDGSVMRMDGSGGVDLETTTGGRMTAPRGSLDFDEENHPQHGLLEGGATLEMTEPARHINGSAPTARLLFGGEGQLRHAHLERGVVFSSQQRSVGTSRAAGGLRLVDGSKPEKQISSISRTWKSQVADITFVDAPGGGAGGAAARDVPARSSSNPVEPRTIHGSGGVVVTSETNNAKGKEFSTLTADDVVAELAAGGAINGLSGSGHARFDQHTPDGAHQTSSSDQLDVRFLPVSPHAPRSGQETHARRDGEAVTSAVSSVDTAEIAAIVQVGNVVITQDPPSKSKKEGGAAAPSQPAESGSAPQTSIRATGARADYDGASQILHLTGSPRVRDGELDLTANQIDFAKASGDAVALGSVKASWSGSASVAAGMGGAGRPGLPTAPDLPLPGASLLSGSSGPGASRGPVHAVAGSAELKQASQEVIFRQATPQNGSLALTSISGVAQGQDEPRLWQGTNSVSAPLIVLNRQKQTLIAQSSDPGNPVRTVLVSNGSALNDRRASAPQSRPDSTSSSTSSSTSGSTPDSVTNPISGESRSRARQKGPSTIRVRSGDLRYSEGERVAFFHSGSLGTVVAETSSSGGNAKIVSEEAEVKLLAAGIHPAPRAAVTESSAGESAAIVARPQAANSGAIEQFVARGKVIVDWPDRRGTGDKLVYLAEDGTFTLTGTGSAPPRITDDLRGNVTGSALVFHTGDDRVTVEGDGAKTVTETQTQKKRRPAH